VGYKKGESRRSLESLTLGFSDGLSKVKTKLKK